MSEGPVTYESFKGGATGDDGDTTDGESGDDTGALPPDDGSDDVSW